MRIIILIAVALFIVLLVRAVIDLIRRPDLGIGAKLLWAAGMLFLPFIGLLIYTMLRPTNEEIAHRR